MGGKHFINKVLENQYKAFESLLKAAKARLNLTNPYGFSFFPHFLSPLKTPNEFSSHPSQLVENTEAK